MENVTVRIGDCACPDAPHPDGDVVYMRPTVSLVLGLACERIIANARTNLVRYFRSAAAGSYQARSRARRPQRPAYHRVTEADKAPNLI